VVLKDIGLIFSLSDGGLGIDKRREWIYIIDEVVLNKHCLVRKTRGFRQPRVFFLPPLDFSELIP
jgi:hypothetical protein